MAKRLLIAAGLPATKLLCLIQAKLRSALPRGWRVPLAARLTALEDSLERIRDEDGQLLFQLLKCFCRGVGFMADRNDWHVLFLAET